MRPRLIIPAALILCAACGGGSGGDSNSSGSHLTVTAADPGQQPCEGSFVPGQTVQISDPRFAPGGEVSLQITPTGGGDQTSILAAGGDGTVTTTIQLPQTPGAVYISVSGMSPTGEQVNDAVGVDVLAAGSTCPS